MGFISSTIIEFIATEVIERGASKASKIFSKKGKVREEEPMRIQPGMQTPEIKPGSGSAEDKPEILDANDTTRAFE